MSISSSVAAGIPRQTWHWDVSLGEIVRDEPEIKGGDPRFYQILDTLKELHTKKNSDYSKGGIQGHLGNFIRVSAIKQLYPDLDWSTPLGTAIDYMLKQLDAALVLYQAGNSSLTGEPIPERLKDVAIYAILGILLYEDAQVTPAIPVDLPHVSPI